MQGVEGRGAGDATRTSHEGARVDSDGEVERQRMLWDGRRRRTEDPFMV